MRNDFSRYFSGSRLARLPLYKAAMAVCCAGLLVVSTGTGIAYAAATALSPEPVVVPVATPSPTATAEPTAEPSPTPGPDVPLTLVATVVQQDLGLEVLMPAPETDGEEQDPAASPETETDQGDKEDMVPALGVEFVAIVADEDGKQTEYPVDPDTATVLIEELDPGDYTVSLAPAEGYQVPEAQTVTVEKKKVYKVDIEKVEEEIVQADEVNEAEEDNSYGGGGSAGAGGGTLSDTVAYAESSSTTVPVMAQAYAKSGNVNGEGYVYYSDGSVSPYKAVMDSSNTYIVSLSLDKNKVSSASSQAAGVSAQALGHWSAPLSGILREDGSSSVAEPSPSASTTPESTATPDPTATPTVEPTATPNPHPDPVAHGDPGGDPHPDRLPPTPTPAPTPTPVLDETIVVFDTASNALVPNSNFKLTASQVQVGTTTQYTGWQTIGGKQYYYDPATHQPVTGVQVIAGEMYTFGADGAMGVNRKGIDVVQVSGRDRLEQGQGGRRGIRHHPCGLPRLRQRRPGGGQPVQEQHQGRYRRRYQGGPVLLQPGHQRAGSGG